MNPPPRLCRYRPLSDELLDRELEALRDSYLYAPCFKHMNDPMEAFYQFGGPNDDVISKLDPAAQEGITQLYTIVSAAIDQFALVSLTGTHEDLPMWAYYASNFAGMCLEFDTAQLGIGALKGEQLLPVAYERTALPAISFLELMSGHDIRNLLLARIARKRIEWAHEKEWRYVTGKEGQKHYLEDALTRVFIGPKASSTHADRVCQVLDRRPVEVLKAEIEGFEMTFRCIKPARPPADCERVGAGQFDPAVDLYAGKELKQFLAEAYAQLLEECRRTAQHPNMERLCGVDLTSAGPDQAIYFWTVYKLRSGREIFHKRYFDRGMRLIADRA